MDHKTGVKREVGNLQKSKLTGGRELYLSISISKMKYMPEGFEMAGESPGRI